MASDPSIATRVAVESVDRLDGAVQARLRQMSKGRLRELIPRAIDGRFRLCVPPMDDDDDLILSALIDEAFALREQVAALAGIAALVEHFATETYAGATDDELALCIGRAARRLIRDWEALRFGAAPPEEDR